MPHRRSPQNVVARFEDLQPFASQDDVMGYLDNEKLECLICGRLFSNLGTHLCKKHGITARSYKEKLNLPLYVRSLIGTCLLAKMIQIGVKAGLPAQCVPPGKPRKRQDRGSYGYLVRRRKEESIVSFRNGAIKGRCAARKRSRTKLLEVIRLSEIGDDMHKAARRAGYSVNTIGNAFRANPDLKAAFFECARAD